GRVGHVAALEAGALITDLDLGALRRDGGDDHDLLGRIELVAVLDRVGDRLVEGELYGEEGVLVEAGGAAGAQDRLLHLAPPLEIGGNDESHRLSAAVVAPRAGGTSASGDVAVAVVARGGVGAGRAHASDRTGGAGSSEPGRTPGAGFYPASR